MLNKKPQIIAIKNLKSLQQNTSNPCNKIPQIFAIKNIKSLQILKKYDKIYVVIMNEL